MNSTVLSLSVKGILGKTPLFTFRGKQFVLANGQFYRCFASVVFAVAKDFVAKKTRFAMFAATPFEVKSQNGIYCGIRSQTYINETAYTLKISDCFFMKMSSDKAPAVVLYDAPSGTINIKASTFLACIDSSKRYGIIYANCMSACIIDSCFRECYAGSVNGTLIQGQFTGDFCINGSMITALEEQVNQSSVLFQINGTILTKTSQINATGIKTVGIALFTGDRISIKESTFRNMSCVSLVDANAGIIETCEFSLINATESLLMFNTAEISNSIFIDIVAPTTAVGLAKFINCSSDKVLTVDQEAVANITEIITSDYFLYGMEQLHCLGSEVRDDCYNTTWASIKFSVAISTWIYIGLIAAATILYFSVRGKLSQPVDETVVIERMSESDWSEVDGIREILSAVDAETPGETQENDVKPEPTKETPLISDTQAPIQ
jgi:hypothetical protein